MDVKSLHTTYATSGATAAHNQIVATGEVKSSFTVADTTKLIAQHQDAVSINWPRILRELARINNPASS